MERVGEHPVPPARSPFAGSHTTCRRAPGGRALPSARVVLGTRARRRGARAGETGVKLSYHWLDDRGNAIVWDGPRVGVRTTVAPGKEVEVETLLRAPQPPGRYRLAFDLVEEFRFWFAEVGSSPLELAVDVEPRISERRLAVIVHGGERRRDAAALAAQEEPFVAADAVATAHLVAGALPEPDWSARVLDAHAEGFAAVGGSIETRDRTLRPWAPGGGRNPASRTRCCCPHSSPGSSRASTRDCRPTSRTGSRRSSTAGSDFDCHAVVHAAEDERAERERNHRRDGKVDRIDRRRRLAEEDRVAHGLDRRRQRIAVVDEVDEARMTLDARDALERVEHRRQEEPGQQKRGDEMLDVAVERVEEAMASDIPATRPTTSAASGIASQTVSRASGTKTRLKP